MSDRFKKGMDILNITNKETIKDMFDEISDIAPDLGKFVVEFPYSEIYTRDGLDLKTRELITVAALTAMGNAPLQLEHHINAALNVNNSPNEIVEAIIQMSAYAGFPAAINGINAAKKVFKERDLLPL
jgi:4-carboxymuconolactone decarboxylase